MDRSEGEGLIDVTPARRAQPVDSGPPRPPEGSPAPYLHPDQHSWILQSVGEMRESIGGLKQAVQTLSERSGEQGKKLDSLSHRAYAFAVLVTGVGVAVGWVID